MFGIDPLSDRVARPVTCSTCGCRLEASTGARDGEYRHYGIFDGRDARGCKVDCVELVHDLEGHPLVVETVA
jgi:hypothetical protein